MKKILFLLLVGIIFLFIWLKIVDFPKLFAYFENVSLGKGILFSFFYLLAYFFRSLRWRLILQPVKKMSILRAYATYMIGLFVNYLIPIRAGEIAKAALLKTKYKVRMSYSLPSIFLDKVFDLLPILLILLLIPFLSIQLNSFLRGVIGLLLLIWIFFFLFLFFSIYQQKKAIKLLHKSLPLCPQKFRTRTSDFFHHFVSGLSVLKGNFLLTVFILIFTFLAVFSEAIFIYSLFLLFGSTISFPAILFGYTLMNLTYILPTPPAQIGSNQFMWTVIFSFALGVNENLTGAVVMFSHLITALFIILIGLLSFLYMHLSYFEVIKIKK
jgi:glycosyltransferase 2 family protein